MIIFPITQIQMIMSLVIAEIYVLSDQNYSVKIGSEYYFNLAFGLFLGFVFVFAFLAIKFGNSIKFKDQENKQGQSNRETLVLKTKTIN